MMYAVIESGGKQYRVAVGDRVKVESLRAEPGDEVQLDNVLLVADGDSIDVGSPYTGAAVSARVVEHGRGPKLRILKFRRRQNSRTHAGHRQNYTELEITGIGGKSAAPKKSAKKSDKAADSRAGSDAGQPAGKEAPAAKQGAGEDLTQLGGVGKVMAEKLQGAGITSLEQIAAWSEDDVARIDEELGFKGRIARDDWVGQARKLTGKTD
jgi:large subunit ribosomal protein L21